MTGRGDQHEPRHEPEVMKTRTCKTPARALCSLIMAVALLMPHLIALGQETVQEASSDPAPAAGT